MPSTKPLEKTPSTGKLFVDLGFADAGEHLIKASLVHKIEQIIHQRALTQTAVAELLGIDQPKVSAMLAGHFRAYSVERLMRFLVALGHDVEIVVNPKQALASIHKPCTPSAGTATATNKRPSPASSQKFVSIRVNSWPTPAPSHS